MKCTVKLLPILAKYLVGVLLPCTSQSLRSLPLLHFVSLRETKESKEKVHKLPGDSKGAAFVPDQQSQPGTATAGLATVGPAGLGPLPL